MRNSAEAEKKETWFARANQLALHDKDRVVGIFDLDFTLFIGKYDEDQQAYRHFCESNGESVRKFSDEHEVIASSRPGKKTKITVQVDPNAMKQIRTFAENGHVVMVATTATYQFDSVRELFQRFKIELKPEYFFNRADMSKKLGFDITRLSYQVLCDIKSKFLVSMELGHNAMLFDDSARNQPPHEFCLFEHVIPTRDFPTFNSPPNAQERQLVLKIREEAAALLTEADWQSIVTADNNYLLQCVERLLASIIKETCNPKFLADKLQHLSGVFRQPTFDLSEIITRVKNDMEKKYKKTGVCCFFPSRKTPIEKENEKKLLLAQQLTRIIESRSTESVHAQMQISVPNH